MRAMGSGSRRKAYKPRDQKLTSAIMSAVRSKDNKAEVILRRELWKCGYRYRLYDSNLPGKPDLVFKSLRLVVFVDGDFWHGRSLIEGGLRSFRRLIRTPRWEWWLTKISRNVERDRRASRELKALGWNVIRFWESSVLADSTKAAGRVIRALDRARCRQP